MACIHDAPSASAQNSLLLTKSGKLKSRFTEEEKLQLLDPSADSKDTYRRLQEFQKLFAFRFTNAIVTRAGQGPRAWTALRGRLTIPHIVLHLLANHIQTKPPRWVGARSFAQSRFFCLDVDADRTAEQTLADEYDVSKMDVDHKEWLLSQQKPAPVKPPLAERRQQVEQALERMGINHQNPNEVLLQRSPSGGYHYYVFFDQLYFIDQYRQLLTEAGLAHVPGEIEFFPSEKQGLRLPFGYIPGREHDPQAWLRFIDKYRSHRIRRHSLETLYANLERSCCRPLPVPISPRTRLSSPVRNGRNLPTLGVPKASRGDAISYAELISGHVNSTDVPQRLLEMGIQAEGSRNQVLNILAAHLIWFQHKSAEEASSFLSDWALNPRHNSVDIQHDLAYGKNRVSKQIENMCCWYEKNRRSNQTPTISTTAGSADFTHGEIHILKRSLANVPEEDVPVQATFLLHFLTFAKLHGSPTDDNQAWEAAPAIRQVIRRWPGCHHMNYKTRIERATKCGVLKVTKEKWQSPNGPGRARTYRMEVCPEPQENATIDYETAMNMLTNSERLDQRVEVKDTPTPGPQTSEAMGDTEHEDRYETEPLPRQHIRRKHAATVCAKSPGVSLGPGPHQRHQKQNATANVPGQNPGTFTPPNSRRRHQRFPSQSREGTLDGIIAAERERFAVKISS